VRQAARLSMTGKMPVLLSGDTVFVNFSTWPRQSTEHTAEHILTRRKWQLQSVTPLPRPRQGCTTRLNRELSPSSGGKGRSRQPHLWHRLSRV
jgi:hypothetical protein